MTMNATENVATNRSRVKSEVIVGPTPSAWSRLWQRLSFRLELLAVLAVIAMVAFMTVGVEVEWSFILQHRGAKLLSMVLVAAALGMSTVVFQTVTHNTILTPAVMGLMRSTCSCRRC